MTTFSQEPTGLTLFSVLTLRHKGALDVLAPVPTSASQAVFPSRAENEHTGSSPDVMDDSLPR